MFRTSLVVFFFFLGFLLVAGNPFLIFFLNLMLERADPVLNTFKYEL
jgi:hypothetical protein